MMEICLPGLVAFPFRARYDDAHKAATHSTGFNEFGCRINTSRTRVRTFSPFPRSPEANLS